MNESAETEPVPNVTEIPGEVKPDQYANLLEAKLPPIKTNGSTWRAFDGGAWTEIDRATLRPRAMEVLPKFARTAMRCRSILDNLEARLQVDARGFASFYKLTDAGGVLLNVANGILNINVNGDVPMSKNTTRNNSSPAGLPRISTPTPGPTCSSGSSRNACPTPTTGNCSNYAPGISYTPTRDTKRPLCVTGRGAAANRLVPNRSPRPLARG